MKYFLYFDPETRFAVKLSQRVLRICFNVLGQPKHDPNVIGVYFPTKDILYFEFYEPDGTFHFDRKFFTFDQKSSEAVTRSLNMCQEARLAFIDVGFISFDTKILYWSLADGLEENDLADDVTPIDFDLG